MYKINFIKFFVFVFICVIASSCDNHNHDGDHINAEGFIFEDENGNEIYRQFEGEITGSISLNIDDILELSVHFLDHDGNEIEHTEDEEDELSFEIDNSDVISIVPEEHEDSEHELGFELVGVSSGTTTFTFSLMHGDHADYVSLAISVNVE